MKTKTCSAKTFFFALALDATLIPNSASAADAPEIRTPAASPTPHINGAGIFGVRPDHPFLYHIPATGDRPMVFSADKLPRGLTLDAATGNITGTIKGTWFEQLTDKKNYTVTLRAKNSLGEDKKKFKI